MTYVLSVTKSTIEYKLISFDSGYLSTMAKTLLSFCDIVYLRRIRDF